VGHLTRGNLATGDGTDTNAAENEANRVGAAAAARAPAHEGGASGFDFTGVRIHADSRADRIASAMGARALTSGNDIYFSRGQLDTSTDQGRALLGHELVHVAQQRQAPP